MNIAAVKKGPYVDPEDWSPQRTQYLSPLAPGASAHINWQVHTLVEGEFAVFVTIVSPEQSFSPVVSPSLLVQAVPDNILPLNEVIPVVATVPIFPLALLLFSGTQATRRGIKKSRRHSQPVIFIISGVTIGIFLVACNGSLAPPESTTADNPPPGQNSTTGQEEESNPPGQDSLPDTDEFGMTREELVRNAEAVEVLIAECMSEAGFEYIAADFATIRRGMVADKSLPGLSEREFFDRYGYGYATLYTGLPPQQANANTSAKIGLGERNVQIYNDLSPADQVAYNRTLLGENTDATFAVSLEAENFARTGGCTRAAIEQGFPPEQLAITYLNPLDALIEQDARMVAAMAEFAECVRTEGFDYSHPEEIENDIKNRLYAITGGAPVEALPTDARAALADLQALERAVAVVALRCEVRHLEPVEEQIERELYAAPVQ